MARIIGRQVDASTQMNQPARLMLYGFIAVLIYFIFIAANRGVGDVKAYTARAIMDGWESGKLVETAQWDAAHESLRSALASSPENPEYLSELGQLYEWRVARLPIGSPKVFENYQRALGFYRQALQKRPAFAFYWANVAVVKSMLGEVDDEYYLAIDRSLVLGAWEPGVQLKIADATLRVWFLLDDRGWKILLENIERGLEKNASAMKKMAKQAQVFNQLCGKLRRTEQVRQFCQ